MINCAFFAKSIVWVSHILFCVALLPQIWVNYKLKSTRGLSDFLIIGYLNGYISYVYYSYLLGLPLAYKVMVPLATFFMLIIAFQRFFYANYTQRKDKYFLAFYVFNLAIAIFLMPIAFRDRLSFGYFFGWTMMLVWATYQIPQVVKVFLDKSVHGFSFSLVSLVAFGDMIELIVAIILKLPVPTLLNDFRGILIYLIFSFQFWRYKESQHTLFK
ncbi:hypothetical protein GF322_04880 [Candidatus Dependentiae bacterium]|nr:hypothetical protein [Candidatus Dependentiae bacterium]